MSARTYNLEQGTSISSDYDNSQVDPTSSSPSSQSLTQKLFRSYRHIKRLALGTLRHVRKNKTMINVDDEAQVSSSFSYTISDDSSVEEVETFDNRRVEEEEDKSVGLLVESFVPLTNEEKAEVSRALSNSNRYQVLVTHAVSNIEITAEVLQCLKPGGWLNDEVINLYLELLKEREKREPEKYLKCHFFNALFYQKLISGEGGYDFKAVRRWTTQRNLGYDLNECDKIFVPIHKEMHWRLAIINKKDEKFQYLDSLKGMDSEVLKVMATYYVDELKDKNAIDVDISSWELEYVDDLPAQQNGWDCGMFMIKYADFSSRGLGLCFDQEDMPYFRKRTAKEILRLKAE